MCIVFKGGINCPKKDAAPVLCAIINNFELVFFSPTSFWNSLPKSTTYPLLVFFSPTSFWSSAPMIYSLLVFFSTTSFWNRLAISTTYSLLVFFSPTSFWNSLPISTTFTTNILKKGIAAKAIAASAAHCGERDLCFNSLSSELKQRICPTIFFIYFNVHFKIPINFSL